MQRNNKVLLILLLVFIVITATGAYYTFSFQKKELANQNKKLEKLRTNFSSSGQIDVRLKKLEEKVSIVDSALFADKFNIPQNLLQSSFYNFIERYGGDHQQYTFTNTEYVSKGVENKFNYYIYKVSGNDDFSNVYGLIYAIEHNTDLMKIQSAQIDNNTNVDSKGVARNLVKFTLLVKVYYSSSDQYTAVNTNTDRILIENIPNAFSPLVKTETRSNANANANTSNLPNIQGGTLLSLVPQGAYVYDTKGNTHLLKKGDAVNMGYLSDIDYEKETATFTLNNKGKTETEVLKMGKPTKKQGK